MKTRFSVLLRLAKRTLDEAERALGQARARREVVLKEIEKLRAEAAALVLPEEGYSGRMEAVWAQRRTVRAAIEVRTRRKEELEREIERLEQAYREAHLEHEKMHHLDEAERAVMIEKLKQAEAKRLDEIASQRALRKRNEREVDA